jgi:hypothetical protein
VQALEIILWHEDVACPYVMFAATLSCYLGHV